jgi:methionyl-tRNA formyltransferase
MTNNKTVMICGRERGLFLLESLYDANFIPSGLIIMNDDDHEAKWSDRIAESAGIREIPFVVGKSFANQQVEDFYLRMKPNVVLTENWRTIVPTRIYKSADHFIVFHESLLPKYRGFAPLVWPLINDEKETGVSMFYASDEIDSGDVLDQYRIPIRPGDSCNELYRATFEVYLEMCLKNLPKLDENRQKAVKQDENQATYCCMRTPEDGRINWSKSANDIFNLVRAIKPPLFAGAYTEYDGQKIVVAEAEVLRNPPRFVGVIPGRIASLHAESTDVLTGQGILRIHSVMTEFNPELLPAGTVLKKMKVKLT